MLDLKKWREIHALAESDPQSCAKELAAIEEASNSPGAEVGENVQIDIAMTCRVHARLWFLEGSLQDEKLQKVLAPIVERYVAKGFSAELLGPFYSNEKKLKSFEQLQKNIKEYAIGPRRRIMFPVVYEKSQLNLTGHLVWADVTVIDLGRLQEDYKEADQQKPTFWPGGVRIAIAPWSFYRYDKSVSEIPVHEALIQIKEPKEVKESLGFLVDFQPLTPDDIRYGEEAKLESLNCPFDLIGGPSVGLALVLAGYTAVHCSMPAPVIATGKMNSDGKIEPVEGTLEKVTAANTFRLNSDVKWKIFVPKGSPKPDGVEVIEADNISELLKPGAGVTDGFDEYIDRLTQPDCEPTHHETWATTRREADAAIATFDNAKGGDTIGVRYVTVPFDCLKGPVSGNDEPGRVAAQWLAWQLDAARAKSTMDLERQIVVALSLHHYRQLVKTLAKKSSEQPAPIPIEAIADWFAAAIRSDYKLQASLNYYRAAFLAALGRKGKLALVVYDRPSIALWNEIARQQELKAYHAMLIALQGLTDGKPLYGGTSRIETFEPQRIVAICSDIYHHNLWTTTIEVVEEIAKDIAKDIELAS